MNKCRKLLYSFKKEIYLCIVNIKERLFMDFKKEYNKVSKTLSDNEADYSDISQTENGFEITIEWGDWKHSHIYLDSLMRSLGYLLSHEQILETDGSDTYSSIHYYTKM